MSLQHEAHTDGHSTSNGKNLIDGHIHTNGHNSTDGDAWSKGHASSTHGHSPTNGHNSTGDMANTNGHYQDDVQSNPALASASAPLEKPLQIIRRALRSLPYVPPGTTRDPELRRAARQLLDDLGDRGDELIAKFFDVGMWCAEVSPSTPLPTSSNGLPVANTRIPSSSTPQHPLPQKPCSACKPSSPSPSTTAPPSPSRPTSPSSATSSSASPTRPCTCKSWQTPSPSSTTTTPPSPPTP